MNSLHNSATIYNCLKKLKLCTFISDVNIKHIIAIMLSVFTIGFKGKTLNFASVSDCHRTTVAHFLNEGKLNDVENAVILITYPQNAFQSPNALRAFISTDVSLSTEEILMHYVGRWQIELFFRESKNKLAFDKCQVRSAQGIKRYWLIMSLTHFVCCTCTENGYCNFTEGYKYFCNLTNQERLHYIYKCVQRGVSFDEIWSWVA